MFVITESPINVEEARRDLRHESCGAIVTFEGRVRDHNDGRTVTGLEYEVHRSLATKEGESILKTLLDEFDIRSARSLHRTGQLELGELAFWLSISAPHRQAAFEACREGVNRIKDRVPIWKKETYADDSSRWINHP
jgi:molybdopterin synthase catalytic subunit